MVVTSPQRICRPSVSLHSRRPPTRHHRQPDTAIVSMVSSVYKSWRQGRIHGWHGGDAPPPPSYSPFEIKHRSHPCPYSRGKGAIDV